MSSLLRSVQIFPDLKGAHDPDLSYKKFDEVQHQTSIYVAAEDIPAGTEITDPRWVVKLDNSAAYAAEQAREEAEALRVEADAARMGFKPMGAYNPANENKYGEWYTHEGGSYGYIWPEPSTGVPLSDTSHWQQIAEKGDKGDTGDVTPEAEAAASTATAQAAEARMYATALENEVTTKRKDYVVRPRFCWTDDDGVNAVYTHLYPWAVANSVPFTTAQVTDWIGNGTHITAAQIQEMHASGLVTFASHFKNHVGADSIENDEAAIIEQVVGSKTAIEALGVPCDIMLYPFGQYNYNTTKIVRKHYRYACVTSMYNTPSYNVVPINTYHMTRQGINWDSNLDRIKAKIDEAVTSNALMIFMSHVGYDGGDPTLDIAAYSEILSYIRGLGYDIEPFMTVANEVVNFVEVGLKFDRSQEGYFYIAPDGSTDWSGLGDKQAMVWKSVDFNTPGTDFKFRKVTGCSLNYGGSIGFPERTSGGTLLTYNLMSSVTYGYDFIYQLWYPASKATNNWYMRKWSNNTSAWTDFTNMNTAPTFIKLTSSSVNYLSPLTDFAESKVSACYLNYAASGGANAGILPSNTGGGMLVTYRVGASGSEDAAASQYWHPAGLDAIYRRRWNSGASEWHPLVRITPNPNSTFESYTLPKNGGSLTFSLAASSSVIATTNYSGYSSSKTVNILLGGSSSSSTRKVTVIPIHEGDGSIVLTVGDSEGTYNQITFTNNWANANVTLTLFSMGGVLTQIV